MNAADEIMTKALQEHGLMLKGFSEKFEKTLNQYGDKMSEFKSELLDVQQKLAKRPYGLAHEESEPGSIGALVKRITDDHGFQQFQKGSKAPVEITVPRALFKTAIINAPGQNQPLVMADRRAGIVTAPQRRFTIRDLFEQVPTESNLVEFAKESTFTNNAGLQFGSPADVENVVKNESGITFSLSSVAVATIAHWIPASRQILSDAPALEQHIGSRLLYGLKLIEEAQLLTGDGTAGNLSGLMANATAYNRGVSNDTKIDCLTKAILQLLVSDYEPSGFVLNPVDWFDVIMTKDTQGRYIFGDPHLMTETRLWGLPVSVTNSMTQGSFLVLDARRAGYVADREDATVRIAETHDNFFVRNMVAILCEERIALVLTQTGAMVKGSLPPTGT